jgi:aminoglycoside phosphotransferase (APT) family kinase protein
MALPDDVVDWVQQQCGGRVVAVEQQGRWRAHHFLTVQRPGGAIGVLARSRRQGVPPNSFLAHFDIAHEARVLEALQGKGLKIPTFLGFNEQHGIILMERVAGTNELSQAPDDDTRKAVMTEYIEQLAHLHRIDIESMKLSGLEIPMTPDQVAFGGKFALMEADYQRMSAKLTPEPLLELGRWWLHANVPRGDRRVSLVQADTGPGQFMFADGHLTALIDWELSHIGDPMLDLGVIRMRNMLYPTGSLVAPIAYYEQVSGRAIDWPALRFYTVMSMLLTPLGLALSMQRPTARVEHMFPSFGWDATLRRGLCDALAEAVGIEVEPPELPTSTPAAERPTLMHYLVEHLELNCAPLASDDAERYQMDCATAIARAAQLQNDVGPALLDADLQDMATVLGRRPRDRADGLAQLNQVVSDGPADRLDELVWLFARIERRREHLATPMMTAQECGDFERLEPQDAAR